MKRYSRIISAVLIFTFVLSAYNVRSADALTYRAGDIIVTNSTSSSGIVGHSGIFINSNTILHTSGWKSEPYPLTISLSKWNDRYEKSKVIRPDSATKGQKAADAAIKYFKGKTINYKITPNPRDINPNTYCSELVWYAYYKAGYSIKKPLIDQTGIYAWYTPGSGDYIYPYDFANKTIMDNTVNAFTVIDDKF
jgi:uncharacterized protein YycO